MKKQLFSLFLAAVLALSLLVPASAAENSVENFARTKTYNGEFSDVSPDSTFYKNAAALYEYGLSVGKSDGSFGLKDAMTVGQIVIFAGRIRSLYAFGAVETGADGFRAEGQAAYLPYLAYLQFVGALGNELDGLYAAAATRAQVAHVLAATLPASLLPAINEEIVTQGYATRQYLTDVTEYTPYYQDILTLYKAGVSVGSDAAGSFGPGDTITRGAAAAMLTRMVDPNLRIVPDWNVITTASSAVSTSQITWGSLVQGGAEYIAGPETQSEIEQDVTYMLSQEKNQLDLAYGGRVSSHFVDQLMNAALAAVKSNCEQMYNTVQCSYDGHSGVVTFLFSAVAAGTDLPTYRDYTLKEAAAVRAQLWSEGTLHTGMSETEIAKVYYQWICDHCVYDTTSGDESLSHIAYALFKMGRAVCDGYTGAYNLFLKMEGIECYALSNPDHIWTVATLDGTQYHIDVTWGDGDSSSPADYTYFAMTEEQSWHYHRW